MLKDKMIRLFGGFTMFTVLIVAVVITGYALLWLGALVMLVIAKIAALVGSWFLLIVPAAFLYFAYLTNRYVS